MVKLAQTNMNLGGPGWFHDVFDVRVYFNTDKRSVPTSDEEDDSIEVSTCTQASCFEACGALGALIHA